MGLRNRIMLLVALGLLIATAPLGIMGLGMVRAATNRILEERLAMARVTADHLSVQLAGGWSELDRLSARVAPSFRRSDSPAALQSLSGVIPDVSLLSGGIVLLDRTGGVVATRTPLPVPPAMLSALSTVRETLATARPQTGVIIDEQGAVALAVFSVPIFRTPAEVSGAVAGIIDLRKPTLLTFINGLAMGASGHATLVSGDGVVLASTDSSILFTRDEHPEFFRSLIEGGRALIGRAEEASPAGDQQIHVTAFAPLTAAPWGVGIGQSEDEAFWPIRRLRNRLIIFETAVLLAALLFAWVDTTAVIRPLAVLRRAAARIAQGDLAQEIDVRRGDEIGALASTFETMRQRLVRSLEENERLQERLQSVAMVEERERIAREMHDSVGQVLGYVNTKVQAVQALLEAGKVAEAEAQLAQLEQAAREVYADLREAILSLRTTTGLDRRLLPALEEYVRRFTEVSGIETALVVDGDPRAFSFSPTVEAHLIRIIQEALTNVRKHALARQATVRGEARGGRWVVTVEDDGVGIASGREGAGFGLQTMRERAEQIGGVMTVRVRSGGGTVVEIDVPADEGGEIHAGLAG